MSEEARFDSWRKSALPEVSTISTGKFDANHSEDNGKYRFYTCSSKFQYCSTKSFSGKSIIVPGNGDIGLVFYYDGDFEAYQRTYVINNIKILAKFLYYHMLLHWRERNADKQFGSTVRYVRMQNFTSYSLLYPPLPEQERIVARIEELFSDLDKGVEALQTIKAQLKVYRQAVLKEAFEGKLEAGSSDAHEKLYLSLQQSRITLGNRNQYSLLEQIDLPDLPSKWHWVCVGDVISSCSYGTSSKSSESGKVPVIRMGNLQNGVIDWDDLAYTSDEAEIEKYKLYPYDVLFNRTNSPEWVGKTAIYKGEQPAIYAGYLIRINYLQGINPQYLAYFLNSPIARAYGKKVKTDGVNQSNINATKLCTYPFPLCGKKTQDKIVAEIESRLSVCDKIEQTVNESLAKAESLRQSILKKAFEGKL